MDEFEDIVNINGTLRWVPRKTLTIPQIIHLVWGIISLIPNGLLFFLIVKSKLHRNNFHFIILNWSIINIILIMVLFCFSAIPQIYTATNSLEMALIYTDTIIRFILILLAIFFVFDKFILSEKFCRLLVYSVWGILGSLLVISLACLFSGIRNINIILELISLLKQIAVLFFLIKWITYCIRGSDEETFKLRLILSGIYITTSIAIWFCTHGHIFRPFIIVIRTLLVFLFYSNGLFNLIILLIYDSSIKMHFYQIFGKDVQDLNVQFFRSKSQTTEMESSKCIPSNDSNMLSETEKAKANSVP